MPDALRDRPTGNHAMNEADAASLLSDLDALVADALQPVGQRRQLVIMRPGAQVPRADGARPALGAKPCFGPAPDDQDFEQEANNDVEKGVEHERGVSHRAAASRLGPARNCLRPRGPVNPG